jgi:outer membrane lipoprotein carrier protein
MTWCIGKSLVVITVAVLMPVQVVGTRPSAAVAAQALQDHLDNMRDFTASFVHDYQGGVLRKRHREFGTVAIKKPGRMRWEYLSPEKKTFVCDGRRCFLSIPGDKQVFEGALPSAESNEVSVLLLAGDLRLKDNFTIQWSDGSEWALRLEPRIHQADFEWLGITMDPSTANIRSLLLVSGDGTRSTFTFEQFRENTQLSDELFKFSIPKGFEVIRR